MALIPQTIPFVISSGATQVAGIADASFGGDTFAAAGKPRSLGVAVASFGATLLAQGTARQVTVWSAAVVEATPAAGQAVKAFGGTFTANGTTAFLGRAVATFGGTFNAIGRRNLSGWSSAVVEVTPAGGQINTSFGGTFTAQGAGDVTGTAGAPFGGTFTATGFDRALGLAVASFSVGNFTSAGKPVVLGVAGTTFGGTFVMVTNVTRPGHAVASFGGIFHASRPVAGQATAAFGIQFTVNGLAIPPTFIFSPPSHEEPIRTKLGPLRYYRLTYATSLIRINGTFVSMRHPSQDVLRAAGEPGVDYFVGGHEYQVTRAIRDELTGLGYEVIQQ